MPVEVEKVVDVPRRVVDVPLTGTRVINIVHYNENRQYSKNGYPLVNMGIVLGDGQIELRTTNQEQVFSNSYLVYYPTGTEKALKHERVSINIDELERYERSINVRGLIYALRNIYEAPETRDALWIIGDVQLFKGGKGNPWSKFIEENRHERDFGFIEDISFDWSDDALTIYMDKNNDREKYQKAKGFILRAYVVYKLIKFALEDKEGSRLYDKFVMENVPEKRRSSFKTEINGVLNGEFRSILREGNRYFAGPKEKEKFSQFGGVEYQFIDFMYKNYVSLRFGKQV